MTFSLHNLDCITWLKSLPSASVDLVVTDPAYESLEKHRKVGTTTRLKHSAASSNDWFEIFPNERFGGLFVELYRVLRPDRHCYMYCDAETMFVAKPIGEAAGFTFWKPIVWDKVRIGMGYHYRARHEFVLFFEKGKRALADLAVPDVIEAERITGNVCDRCRPPTRTKKGRCAACGGELRESYPTEKPAEVSEVLISQSSQPGELVVDPFMGSGSVGVAAIRSGRRFAGNDLSADAVEIARTRIDGAGRGAECTGESGAPPR